MATALVPVNGCQFAKFQLPGSFSFGDIEEVSIKSGAVDLPRRFLADKFLYVALVPVNAYQPAKPQLPNSITFRDIEGSQNKKNGAVDLPRPP